MAVLWKRVSLVSGYPSGANHLVLFTGSFQIISRADESACLAALYSRL